MKIDKVDKYVLFSKVLMYVMCGLAFVVMLFVKNWHAAAWIIVTIIWFWMCNIAMNLAKKAIDLCDKFSKLRKEETEGLNQLLEMAKKEIIRLKEKNEITK